MRKIRPLIVLLGVICLGILFFSNPPRRSLDDIQKIPELVAHRAIFDSDTPPNSISALREVFNRNPGGEAEIDVRVTLDSRFVLLHDSDLQNETNGVGRVEERAFSELAGFARKDDHGNVTREPIASLEDVFMLLREYPRARLQIDAKLKDEQGFAVLADFISSHPQIQQRVTISSGQREMLCTLSRQFPKLMLGFDPGGASLSGTYLLDVLRYLKACKIAGIYIDFHNLAQMGDSSAQRIVRQIQARGIFVAVWTVDDPEKALRVFAWGADKMTTNRISEMFSYARFAGSYVNH